KPRSAVQQHVRDHIEDFVALKTRMRAGEVATGGPRGGERPLGEDRRPFFVHPRTGLLKANPHHKSWSKDRREAAKAQARELLSRMRVIDAKTQLHLLADGAWWEVKLAPIGDGSQADVVLRANLSRLKPLELYGRSGVRACAKRQLNRGEKKKFDLA